MIDGRSRWSIITVRVAAADYDYEILISARAVILMLLVN